MTPRNQRIGITADDEAEAEEVDSELESIFDNDVVIYEDGKRMTVSEYSGRDDES